MTQKEEDRFEELKKKIDELLNRPILQPIIVQPYVPYPYPHPYPYPYTRRWYSTTPWHSIGRGSQGGDLSSPDRQNFNQLT